ncbi:MAG: Asp-tRNA(Asn)/Glu-tRNA(Gln) amidotransferase subunit GatA [Elusimicrobiota bacterium]|jgi:aspartyl-tRNA(Asn)/glutamyl-tRNA(Gln) amidotransferase subunit A|nr:Asp-tRNA(Asn)/Glu-tRNA(Gln) amidotransferase subunit GatA [Elusimicrobiota bacterium]
MIKAREIAKKVQDGSLKAVDVISASLAKITELNPKINAFLEVFADEALARAKEIDAKEQKGRLAGVPIALKDNILYKGHKASCASKMLQNYTAVYSATVVKRLLAEDAIIIGRTNMDEFAMGSSNENSAFGIVRNPLDYERVPGGSSGGSAAAVASGMASVALGSDTGGSVRQPAAFCGICGVKPTYGLVSRYGLVAFSSSADQIGPLTLDAEDNELILSIIAGPDEQDSTTVPLPFKGIIKISDSDAVEAKPYKKPQEFIVGLPKEFLQDLDPQIKACIMQAKTKLESQGVKFKEISLPYAKYASPCYHILTGSEASSNLARFDGLRYGFASQNSADLEDSYLKNRSAFGPEVKRRIMLGTFSLGSAHAEDYYKKAQKVRAVIRKDFERVFKEVDLILTPTTPHTAFKIGEKQDDILSLYLSDLFTAPANIAGVPSLSVPFGKDDKNLPVGVQIYGNYFEESKIYALAKLLGS